MAKVTKGIVEKYLRGSSVAAYEVNGYKGVYVKSLGPAASFRKIGRTWREVLAYFLSGENTPAADRMAAKYGIKLFD